MLFLAFALYSEAAAWIRFFSAKRLSASFGDTVFSAQNEEAAVTILLTGSGPVPAAASLSRMLSQLAPKEDDIFVNIGSCGCPDESLPLGQTVLIHRLLEAATSRSFYPDLLFMHSFPERSLTTQAVPKNAEKKCAEMLYDMEGAALFQAALPFFSTDRMFFFKIVSDYGANTSLSPTALLEYSADALPAIWESLQNFNASQKRAVSYTREEEEYIAEFCRLLDASESMRLQVRRLIMYYELERGYAIAMLREFMQANGLSEDGRAPLSRKEGKSCLERFRETCLC